MCLQSSKYAGRVMNLSHIFPLLWDVKVSIRNIQVTASFFLLYIYNFIYIISIYLFSLHELMLPSLDYNMLCKFLLASEYLLNKSLMCMMETECNSRLMCHC